jgi:hypothetical protein
MIALMSGDLKIYARALETYEPNYIGRPASIFFMLESHDPQEIAGHAGTRALPIGRQDLETWDTWRSGALS